MFSTLDLYLINSPEYNVINILKTNVHVRKYKKTKWLTTKTINPELDVGEHENFLKLFQFIEKNNIEMTTPVVVSTFINDRNLYAIKMGFFFPNYINIKLPIEEDIKIEEERERIYAVIIFKGYQEAHNFISYHNLLLQIIEDFGYKAKNKDVLTYAKYDDPYKSHNRQNEVWIEVEE